MKVRNILFTLSLVLVLILAACGGADNNNDNNNNENVNNNENANEEANVTDEEVTLKIAALESGYGGEMWKEIAEAYESHYDNVTIELELAKNIEEVMRPEMQAGNYPDVFMLATDRDEALTETMIKENALESIDDIFSQTVSTEDVTVEEKLLEGFTDTLATNPYADGETYMAPMFYSPTGLFYNKALLEEHGWDLPETWEDMWELGEKAEEEGISLFTYPVAGYFDTFIGALLYASGGPDLFDDAMTYTEDVWYTDEATRVLEVVEKLAEYTHPNTVANANPNDFTKNQQLVLDNEAIFMPNGNWVIGEMEEAPRADGFEWGMMPVPSFGEEGEQYAFTFFEQIWIPKEAENKEVAKDFLTFLYSDEAADIFYETGGAVQPIEGMVDKLDEESKVFYSVYEEGALPAMGTFASTEPVPGVSMGDELYERIDSLMSERLTLEEWQEAISEASDKLREAMN